MYACKTAVDPQQSQANRASHLFLSLIILYLSFFISGSVLAVDLSVFGSETFVRESGAPVVVERSFTVANPSASYTLQIINGNLQDDTTTSDLVSSSRIHLNGIEIVGPQNFNQNITSLNVPITLQTSNTLLVELRGKKGGQLTLTLVRDSNQTPVANAGTDQTVFIGDTVQLNASASTDAYGDPLTYQWQILTKPAESQATLNDPAIMSPNLVIDQAGSYTIELVVNDGFEDSVADQVIIDTANSAPVAQAGSDQTAFVGENVLLDSNASYDVDGDSLSYQWELIDFPINSQANLSLTNSSITDFTIDKPGHYVAELIVNDGDLDSTPDQVAIDTINSAPVAITGNDQTGFVDQQVLLDGGASFDVDEDTLTYAWSMLKT